MSLQASHVAFLKEALRSRDGDSFERVLGRAIRRLGGGYDEYMAIILEVREYGRAHNVNLRMAAGALAGQP